MEKKSRLKKKLYEQVTVYIRMYVVFDDQVSQTS